MLAAAPPTADIAAIRAKNEYKQLLRHRRIEIKVIPAHLDPDLTDAADFSAASIDGRIQAGYDDAKCCGVGW